MRIFDVLEVKCDYAGVCVNEGLKVQQQEAFLTGTSNPSQS